jgi:UDP-N-acetylglucosamine 1-carboxyvinyltransferase
VAVGGSKNAALPIMAAALMADGISVLHGVPELADVATLSGVLGTLGVRVARRDDGALTVEPFDDSPCVADYDLVRRMRASVCVLGPLLARRGRACVSLPGGCAIGDRPIDLHLKGLRALGADVRVEHGYVVAEAGRLRGATVFLGGPFGSTVTGTCNVMAAAALAEGVTTIEAAACEPEVVDLGRFLNRCGAKIEGLGTPLVRVEGVDRLTASEHTVIPDRIEAATLMIAAAITGGRVELENVDLACLTAVVETLRGADVCVESGKPKAESGKTDLDSGLPLSAFGFPLSSSRPIVTISAAGRPRAVDVTALPYPGVPTDVQAQFMALLTVADGISVVTDKVFPDRFLHAAELVRLGARIRREGPSAVVSGVSRLSGASVMASDLRASAALVLAALAADGPSIIRRIYHLDRGYRRLEDKLNRLGADVRRLPDGPLSRPVFQPSLPAGHRIDPAESLAPPAMLHQSARTKQP